MSFGVFCGLANGRLERSIKKTRPQLATGMGAAGSVWCLLVSFALGSADSSMSMSVGTAGGASISVGVIGPGTPRLGTGGPRLLDALCAVVVPALSHHPHLVSQLDVLHLDHSQLHWPVEASFPAANSAGCTGIKSGTGVAGTGSSVSSGGSSPISSSMAGIAMLLKRRHAL